MSEHLAQLKPGVKCEMRQKQNVSSHTAAGQQVLQPRSELAGADGSPCNCEPMHS